MQQARSLEESTKRLRELAPVVRSLLSYGESWLDSLPLPAWVKRPDGQMDFVNAAYESVYDVTRDDYIGRTDAAVWDPATADEFRANDLWVMQAMTPMLFEEKAGDGRPITVLKFPVTDGAKLLGVGGILITDDRAAGIPRLTAQRP